MRFAAILLASYVLASTGCVLAPYQKIDGKWCYVSFNTGTGRNEKVLSTDLENFKVFPGQEYAMDSNTVFFRGNVIEGAHPPTFEPLPSPSSPLISYSRDKHRVFFGVFEIRGANPSTFEVIDGPYSRDSDRIYCGSIPMNVAQTDDFEVVYWCGMVETGDDEIPKSFGPEFDGFEGLCTYAQGWSRDGQFYYYGPGRIEGRDYSTFEVINYYDARDKDGRFCGDRQFRRRVDDPDET